MLLRTFHCSAPEAEIRGWCDQNLQGFVSLHEWVPAWQRSLGKGAMTSVTLTDEEDCILFLCAFPASQYGTAEESEDIVVEEGGFIANVGYVGPEHLHMIENYDGDVRSSLFDTYPILLRVWLQK